MAERPNAALGYVRGRDGPEPLRYPSIEHAGGAGALYSTIRDLYRWDRALYTDQLARQSTIERVFTPHLPYENSSMGYGWVIGILGGRPMAMHGGFMPGVTGIVARFMEDDAVIIVLNNTDWAPVNLIVEGLAEIVFGGYYELPVRHTASLIDLAPSVFDRYVGEYGLPEMGMSLTAQRDQDRFYLHLRTRTDEQTIELYPTSQTSFVADLGDTEIEFVLDETGAADRLKVISAGQTLVAMRLGADAPPSVGPTSDQARLLSALQAGVSYNERFHAATLPGVLTRVPHLYDWLLVAIVLIGVVSVGQEFAWGTVRAALARGVPRVRFVLAKFLALSAWAACCLSILWAACAVLGAWTTYSLKGAVDWSFIDQAFWREQLGSLARTWLIALSTVALTLAIHVWVGRPGPAFGLLSLGYFFSLISYLFLIALPLFVMMRPDADAAAFGSSFWARLIELLPHYNSRVVAHWGEPGRMYEMDYSAWTISQLLHLRYDPWYASGLLVLYGLVPLLWAVFSFRRREMTS